MVWCALVEYLVGCDRSAGLCHNCYNSHNSSWGGPVTILSSRFIGPDCSASPYLTVSQHNRDINIELYLYGAPSDVNVYDEE